MIQHNNYKNKDLRQILDTFSHYQQVNFALYCSKEVETLANNPIVIEFNQFLQRWLKGDKSVDLITARTNAKNNARNAFNASAYPAAYAWNTAYYAVAVTAYDTDSFAADAAYHAARAKSYNLYPDDTKQSNIAYKQFFKEYHQIAQNWLSNWAIPNFPKEESDFPIFDYLIDTNLVSCLLPKKKDYYLNLNSFAIKYVFDFLQDHNLISSLLPKKEDYYYLNLNGFNIKHHNELELLKLIDTTHIKNIIRRIINNDSAQQL